MDLKKEDLYTSLLEGGEETETKKEKKALDYGADSSGYSDEEYEKEDKREDESCFTKIGKSCFSYMFPAAPKHAYTISGIWLRKLLMCATFTHICLIVFSLSMVGYLSFLCNALLFILSFSGALTLRTPTLCCYFLALLGVIFYDLFYGLFAKPRPNQSIDIQKFGLLFVAAFYLLLAIFVGKAFKTFKEKGGIKGNQEDEDDVDSDWEFIDDQDFANILQKRRSKESRHRRKSTVKAIVSQRRDTEALKKGLKKDSEKSSEVAETDATINA